MVSPLANGGDETLSHFREADSLDVSHTDCSGIHMLERPPLLHDKGIKSSTIDTDGFLTSSLPPLTENPKTQNTLTTFNEP